jgi:hypothetical protein
MPCEQGSPAGGTIPYKEASMSLKQGKIDGTFLGTRILMKVGQQLPFHTLLQGKINFQQKGARNLSSF